MRLQTPLRQPGRERYRCDLATADCDQSPLARKSRCANDRPPKMGRSARHITSTSWTHLSQPPSAHFNAVM